MKYKNSKISTLEILHQVVDPITEILIVFIYFASIFIILRSFKIDYYRASVCQIVINACFECIYL